MIPGDGTEGLLRRLAPQVLGRVARRYGDFAAAEDATQEALLAAATTWPVEGEPENPLGWLIRVAHRRMADRYRSEEARRRREDLAASWSLTPPDPAPGGDDSLILLFLCCHPSLPPASAIPLTLRAVGGLTTREIAAAFLVPESTMAQRISRAKAKVKASAEPFTLPGPRSAPSGCGPSSTCCTCCSTRATPPAAAPTWPAPTCPAKPSAWPGPCGPPCPTTPRWPVSSPSCC